MPAFNREFGLVEVEARLAGPGRKTRLCRLALDTGAVTTLISPSLLEAVGYVISADADSIEVVSVSGTHRAPVLNLRRIAALGRDATQLRIVAYELPREAEFDGLLGLDFFRNTKLTLDFRTGLIEID